MNRSALLAVLLMLGVVCLSGSVPRPPTGPGIYWGAYVEGAQTYGKLYGGTWADAPWDARTVARFQRNAGKVMSVEHFGVPAFWKQPFDAAAAGLVTRRGAIPAIDVSTGDASLREISDGRYDESVRAWAKAARAFGRPFFLLLDEEMNGTWYPYSVSKRPNTAASFVAAWRHLHDVFDAVGATDVTWVWCPNVDPAGVLTPYRTMYPGNAYVDWTCLNGYNWGSPQWGSFTNIFGTSYASLSRLAPDKPVMIGEVGSNEVGGSKATWIQDMLTQLPKRFPRVKAFLWFNWRIYENGRWWPWEIESSSSAKTAFARGIASPYYAAGGSYGRLRSLTKVQPLAE